MRERNPPLASVRLPIADTTPIRVELSAMPAMAPPLGVQTAHRIPVTRGGDVSITIVRPAAGAGALPAVVYVLGDEVVIGRLETRPPLGRADSADAWPAIVCVNQAPSAAERALPSAVPDSNPHDEQPMPPTAGPGGQISPREREVLALVALGQTNKEIAEALYVAPSTVKTHVTSLMTKLDAVTRTHLATIAMRRGLLPD